MARDKQLLSVDLDRVIEKRRLDQALNAKEFAVLAGISYSAARTWFRRPGFPVCCGVVFWEDFVRWRTAQAGWRSTGWPTREEQESLRRTRPMGETKLPARAALILAEAG